VVAVGGTSVTTDGSGVWTGETAWDKGGGGNSAYVVRPAWQARVIGALTGGNRGTPDLAADADPASGVAAYDSTAYKGKSGWLVFGGTSVSAPCVAGMVNASGVQCTSTTQFLTALYENDLKTPCPFTDITIGSNGFPALAGWDYATGVGTPQLGSGSFALNPATVTGMDVLDLVGNLGTADPAYTLTGDTLVSLNDLDFLLLQLGW
jgi:subtilase family serine protease